MCFLFISVNVLPNHPLLPHRFLARAYPTLNALQKVGPSTAIVPQASVFVVHFCKYQLWSTSPQLIKNYLCYFCFRVSTCGSTVSENCTYVQNPSYPSSYTTAGSCEYTVTPLSADICQLRLDFDNLDITETTAGACTDSFAVTSGSSRVYPTLCGTLTGKHSKYFFKTRWNEYVLTFLDF